MKNLIISLLVFVVIGCSSDPISVTDSVVGTYDMLVYKAWDSYEIKLEENSVATKSYVLSYTNNYHSETIIGSWERINDNQIEFNMDSIYSIINGDTISSQIDSTWILNTWPDTLSIPGLIGTEDNLVYFGKR